MYEIYNVSRKRKLASRYEDSKIIYLEKLQIKANPDNTTDNILKLFEVWCNFKYYHFLSPFWPVFLLQFFQI